MDRAEFFAQDCPLAAVGALSPAVCASVSPYSNGMEGLEMDLSAQAWRRAAG